MMLMDVDVLKARVGRYRELNLVYPLLDCDCSDDVRLCTDSVSNNLYIECSCCGDSKKLPLMFLEDDMDAFLSIQENFERAHS